ncbi:MAG: hypothetical protein KGM44_11580 [bacterium]|nr:hypothetical protein [bacterium]
MLTLHAARGAALALAAMLAAAIPALASVDRNASFAAPAGDALTATEFADLTTRGPAPLTTTAALQLDEHSISVRFRAEQGGVPITATQTTNNVGFGVDDYVGVGIDTSGNGTQVYYFEISPRGVRYQQSSESSRFDPPWQGTAVIDQGNWTATLLIPLRALRLRSGHSQTWRINFIRRVAARGEDYSWAYSPLMDSSPAFPNVLDARFWPALREVHVAAGLVRLAPHGEVYALGSAGSDRSQFQVAPAAPDRFARAPIRAYGGDLTYPLTGSLAMVATLSPDFSNVETDQQTIAPQEFPRALSEYRPFFAQGAAFFNPNPLSFSLIAAPDQVFYSPNIGSFDRGLKLEGTFGMQSIGAMEIKGAGFDDEVYGFQHLVPGRSFQWCADGVAAHHANGNDTTTEGGIEWHNLSNGLIYGLDGALERGTFVTTPGAGHTLGAFVDVRRANYEANVGWKDVGPQFAPLDGYTSINDARGPVAYVNLLGNGSARSVVKSWLIALGADRLRDGSGAVREADTTMSLDLTFKNLIHLTPGSIVSELRGYAQGYPAYTGGQTKPFNQHNFGIGYRDGTPTPLDFNYIWGPFSNFYLQQFTSSTSRPLGRRASISFEYDGTLERFTAGGRDGQWLRRVSLAESLGPEENLSLGLRSVSGSGGFARPGVNLSVGYHRRFANGGELYVDYGTPAAVATLNRLIVKYVLNFGGGTGT